MIKKLIIFDLDHTLIRKNSSFSFYLYICKKGFFSFKSFFFAVLYFIKFRFFSLPIITLHEKVFENFLRGKELENFSNLAEHFWKKNFEKFLCPKVLKRLISAQSSGDYVLILSSSPNFLVSPLAKRLKVNAFRGSEYESDSSGKLCKISKVICGLNKAKFALALAKDLNGPIVAYSDCISDLPLLKIADEAICVRPKKKLRDHCKKYNWEIIT